MIVGSNIISIFCITFLIFVHWKKGPAWWLRVSDKVFFLLLLTNYILLPLINNVALLYFIIDPNIDLKNHTIESYIVFFNVICFMRIVEYLTIVRRTVLLDARIFLQARAEQQEKSAEEIRSELLQEGQATNEQKALRHAQKEILDEKSSYLERERGYGQGEVRVGDYLRVGEDIYSLGFISQISDKILDVHFDVIAGRLYTHKEMEERQ